jgi:phosphatidate cytidylyltransferase
VLKYRFISGVAICVAVLLAVLFAQPLLVFAIVAILGVAGQLEFYGMCRKAGVSVFTWLGVACGVALVAATVLTVGPSDAAMAATYRAEMAVVVFAILAVCIRHFPRVISGTPLATVACTLFGFFYVPFTINFFTRLIYQWSERDGVPGIGTTGARLILFSILVIKITDVGAYTFGRLFGRHKLCPNLSPNKTREGAVGGVSAAVAASCICWWAFDGQFGNVSFAFVHAPILGVLLAVVGMVGDLFESLIKRTAGVKDSGNAIPGMGGVLDVLDSLLFGVPVLYVYLTFVA